MKIRIRTLLMVVMLLITSAMFMPKAEAKVLTAQELADRMRDVYIAMGELSQEEINTIIEVKGDIIELHNLDSGEIELEIDCSDGVATFPADLNIPNVIEALIFQKTFDIKNTELMDYIYNIINNEFSLNESFDKERTTIIEASEEEQDEFF